MPDEKKEGIAKNVLKQYLSLERNNPGGLSDEQIVKGIPEFSTLALNNQDGIKALRGFKTTLDSASQDQIPSLIDGFTSTLGGTTENVIPSTQPVIEEAPVDIPVVEQPEVVAPEVVQGEEIPVVDQGISKDIVKTFLSESRNTPGGFSDELIFKKLNESGIIENQQDIVSSLRDFEANLDQQPTESVNTFVQDYVSELDNILKKKDAEDTSVSQEAVLPQESTFGDSSLDLTDETNPQNNILSQGFNVKDENGRPMPKGSLVSSINEDRVRVDPFEFAKNFGEWDVQTFESLQDTRAKQKEDFNDRIKGMDNRLSNIFRSSLELTEEDNINRLPQENSLVNDVVYGSQLTVPENVTPRDYPTLFDVEGNLISGVADRYSAVQRQEGNEYLAGLSSDNKKKFIESLGIASGEERDGAFSGKMDEISINFLSEDDLKIKKIQGEVAELEKTPSSDRTADFQIELKQKQTQLRDLKNNRGLYDPETGEFISGNKDVTTKGKAGRTEKLNDAIDQFQVAYEKTDLGKLQKKRDELYFRYKSFTEDFMLPNWDTAFTPGMKIKYTDSKGNEFSSIDQGAGDRDLKAVVTYDDVENPGETKEYEVDLSTQRQRVKFVGGKTNADGLLVDGATDGWNDKLLERQDNLLAEYMAVNRILSLNIDPGQVEDSSFRESLNEGVSESLGTASKSDAALADRSIKSLEEIGFSITDEQKDKVDKTFGQKAGKTIGSSIPASIEIGAQIMLGNKALGIAKVGKAIKTLSKGNKGTEFMLNMIAETAVQSVAFSRSDESGVAGAGEGVGQFLAGAALGRFGVKNKIINFGARLIAGAATETVAEFSGQFLEEMTKNGLDMDAASEKTFGKTPDETMEKIALTYVTGLALGALGAGQDSKAFLQEHYSEISKSDSSSPIVEYAKKFDITKDFTEEDQTRLDEINSTDTELSEEETFEKSVLEVRKEFTESPDIKEDISPVVSKNDGDTEYKFKEDGAEGFSSEAELTERLEDEAFVEKIKAGEVELEINNPSPEIEAKLEEKFPATESEAGIDIESVQEVDTGVIEDSVEEDTSTESKPEIKEEVDTRKERGLKDQAEAIEAGVLRAEQFTDEQLKDINDFIDRRDSAEADTAQAEAVDQGPPASDASIETLAEDISNTPEGRAPFSLPKTFDSTIKFSQDISAETGLKGDKLFEEVKTRLSENFGEDIDLNEVDEIKSEIIEAVKSIESNIKPEPAVTGDQKVISDAASKISDFILSKKIDVGGLDQLSSSPLPIIQAAVNTALTTAAATVRVTGNVAQAVADGITALKKSDWYKGLSEEGRVKAEENVSKQLNAIISDSEVTSEESKIEKKKTRVKKPRKKVEEVKKEAVPGELKSNSGNQKFAERVSQQSDLKEETRKEILDSSKNQVRNQKELLKGTSEAFNRIMSETNDKWQEVINVADRADVDPDITEMLYGHVMQHLSDIEKSKDPKVSKAASNALVILGIKTSERLNKAGKQIKAIGTVYANFPMYVLYSNISRIEHFANRTNNKEHPSRRPGEIKKEASADIESVISDIENNLDELLKDPEISKKLKSLRSKLEGRPVRPKKLTNKKKAELKKKRSDILKKRFGFGNKLQSGIPGGEQAIGIVELAATFIEEGFYRSQDIVSAIKDVLKTVKVNLDDNQIKEILKDFDRFEEILEAEKNSTRKDTIGESIADSVGEYLREGLEFSNLSLKDAIVSSDSTKEQIRKDLIENIKNDFEVSESDAKAIVRIVDQIFKQKSAEFLKKSMDKFYPKISVAKAVRKNAIDSLVDDVALGAFDTTLEFMDMTFKKYGMVNTNDPDIVNNLKTMSDKVRNAPEGVIKDARRKTLETFIHDKTSGYGVKDWLMTRFYGSILSGPITHAKNLKYNTFAIGLIGPLTQIYTQGANPISTYKTMIKQFYNVDRKAAAHYVKTGNNFIDPGMGPKAYADGLKFNLIKNGFTKLLNVASTRMLVASDLIMTRPYAAAVFKNRVKAWLKETQGLKGNALEKAALEEMGYTQSNVDKSSKQALEDVKADYGFDPFGEDITKSVRGEAAAMLLLRTQEAILENSGIEEKMGADSWLDKWTGESLQESSLSEAKSLALQGEVNGFVGIVSDLLEKILNVAPSLKYKVPFVRILGNMLNTAIKWTPGLGQAQVGLRYAINKSLTNKGMQTVSSSSIWALDKWNAGKRTGAFPLLKTGALDGFNKNQSFRQSKRDLQHLMFITGTQMLIYSLMAKDDDDEGLVITGMLDQSFFTRGSVEKGTGTNAYGVYWRGEDGDMTKISDYKNSAYGFALSFFGSMSDGLRTDETSASKAFLKSWLSSPFYIADKPAATSLKELWDAASPTDQYGNNKYLDDVGYKDRVSVGVSNFINAAFVPNLFKQSNKISEQVYGDEAKRATDWWQSLIKGLPWANQNLLETQVDHFGQPIEQKFDLGFLGIEGNAKEGFTMLDPKDVDPYYEVYTDHGQTPKWFTQKEIPAYEKNEFGFWHKVKISQPDGGTDTGKIRISKYEAHIINALIGENRKEGIDNFKKFSFDENQNVQELNGIEALQTLDGDEFKKKISKIDSKAKEKAFIDFFDNYYGEDVKFSNEEKATSFLKVE